MVGDQRDDRLKDLGKRVKSAQLKRAEKTGASGVGRGKPAEGMAVGVRITVEMIAGLAVGVGIGLYADHELGTAPWLLILGFLLGAGASFANVLRTARELDARQARERQAAIDREKLD
jgi:ATP synthase protein I